MGKINKEMRHAIEKAVILSIIVSLLISVGVMALVIKNKKDKMEYQAVRQGNILKYSVDTTLLNLDTLAAVIVNGNGEIENFDVICEDLMNNSTAENAISSLQLAPNGVVTQIYPEQGNEAGKIDLFADPDRKTEAEWARDTGNMTLAGPYELLQGGFAAVARKPVYLKNEQGEKEFWGFVIEVLNMNETLQPAHLDTFERDGYDYCFWRKDPKTGEKAVICESTKNPLRHQLTVKVKMPNVTWYFDVMPKGGWLSTKNIICILLFVLVSAILAAGAAVHLQLRSQKKIAAKRNVLLRKSLNNIANNVAVFRVQGGKLIPVIANKQFLQFMNYSEIEFAKMDTDEFVRSIGCECYSKADSCVLKENIHNHDFESQIINPKTGEKRWFLINNRIAGDENGIELLYITMTDISEEKQQEEELRSTQKELESSIESRREWEYHAEHDALTGLLNRKAYERVVEEINQSKTPVGFLLIDIDYFKEINDDYGHEAGDKLLVRSAEIVKQYIRERDYAFRFGGDEFVVLLCNVTLESMKFLVQRIHEMSEQLSLAEEDIPIAHFSAGLYFSEDGINDITYRHADEALYHTKQNGRAGCTVMDGEMNVLYEQHEDRQSQMHMPKNQLMNEISTGIWRIEIPDNDLPRLYCDENMRELIDGNEQMTPEQCYEQWFKHIDPESVDTVLKAVEAIVETGHAEVNYPWHHPKYGTMKVRCGGTVDRDYKNGICMYGVHQNITDTMVIGNEEHPNNDVTLYSVNKQIFNTFQVFLGLIDLKTKEMRILDDSADGEKYVKQPLHIYDNATKFTAENLIVPEDRERFLELTQLDLVEEQLQQNGKFEFTINRLNKDRKEETYIYHFCYFGENQEQIICLAEELESLGGRDAITDEMTFDDFLRKAEYIIHNTSEEYVMLHFDIKGFKAINEQVGFERGNLVLKHISEGMKKSFLNPLAITRGMADHFYCLIKKENVNYQEIIRLCNQRIQMDNITLMVTMQCGIYFITDTTIPVRYMCDKARLAENTVEKDDSGVPYFVFTDFMKQEYLRRKEIIASLDDALENKEFHTYFQPVYNAKTKKIASAEALVRWVKSDGQIIPPDVFIPTLEANGQMSRIDMSVNDFVQKKLLKRFEEGKKLVPISVNLSRMDFYNEKVMEQLVTTVKNSKVPTNYLRFEITESAYAEIPEQSLKAINTIREYGAKLLIDDFGKGYSSLGSLTEQVFDVVKLDMSFIRQIGKNDRAEAVITAAIEMAHMMKAAVIAEGVETQEQYEFLRGIDCNYIQGYYFSKPLPQTEFEQLLDREEE